MTIIYYDFETSGLNVFHDQIIEISAENNKTGETFTELCNIGSNILPYKITELTGLTMKDLNHKDVRSEEHVLNTFCHFIHKATNNGTDQIYLVAHNSTGFDMLLLKSRALKYNICIPQQWRFIDSLLLAKLVYPHLNSYSLKNICASLYIQQIRAHRASDDVRCMKEMFEELIDVFLSKYKADDHDSVIEYIWKKTHFIL